VRIPLRPGAPRRAVRVGLAALALAGPLACGRPTGEGAGFRRASGLDVVLVSIDTLRADALGAYGRAGADTPWIDRLAAAGVRFETARAHNVVTLPSHASLLSGHLPLGHGIRDNSGFRFPRELDTLATVLSARGYRTGAFVSAFVLDSRFGLDRGFDVYDDRVSGASRRSAFAVPERSAPDTVAAALAWLEAAGERPSFLFVHLYEPHSPYAPSEPHASRHREAPYQGEVAAADAALEPLLRPLVDGTRRRPALVVLTSDHGESLGEHGEETHGVFAYEATLRVPLVLAAPGLRPRVVREPVRLVDVMPTVLDVLGVEPPPGLDGRSLLPLALAGPARAAGDTETYFEALSASLDRGWAPLHGLVRGSLKYVELPIPELYDLARDPAESTNLAARRPDERERLAARLRELRASDRVAPRVREDAATRERLRALGYVAGGASPTKERHGPEDDPKRLIALERREAEILRRFRAGDHDGARALCRETLAGRPDMALTWTQLASVERARGALGEAVDAARRAAALRPDDPATIALLGGLLVEAGRPDEARRALAPLRELAEPDPDVLVSEGMALARLGRSREALAVFERARSLDPANADLLVNLATVHLLSGDAGRAAAAFEAALALDPGLPAAHNGLGVIAARGGRPEQAVAHWKRAAELDPRDYRTLFNLGATLRGLGRASEARPYLEAYLRAAPPQLERADVARVRAWLAGGS